MPDVVWFNAKRRQLYVAVGDPGVVDVFDTTSMKCLGRVATEARRAYHRLPAVGRLALAFLPASHRAALYRVEN